MLGFPYVIITISVFTILLLLTKKPRYNFDLMLAALIFFIGFQHIYHILVINGIQTTFLPLRSGAYPLTFGPLLYFYFIFVSHEKVKFKLIFLLHFLPFIILFLLEGFFGNIPFIENPSFPLPPIFPLPSLIYLATIFLSVTTYSTILLFQIAKHKQKTINYFSNLSIWKDLTWIDWMLILYVVSNILIPFFHFIYSDNSSVYLVSLTGIVLLFFISGLSYFGIRQTIVFNHLELSKHHSELQQIQTRQWTNENSSNLNSEANINIANIPDGEEDLNNLEKQNQKYKKSGLKEEEILRIIKIMHKYLEDNKPYLDPDFTMEIMSRDLKISKHRLSQCLNGRMKKSFHTLVNEYRIEEVKLEILKNKNEKLNFLNLAFAKGFNSKSSFNSVFKNLTGLTPSEYQRQI